MDTLSSGYRSSHLYRGYDYHAKFTENPRRRMTWNREQLILDEIYHRYLAESSVDHLDFACGTGRILKHFEKRVSRSIGVDLSASMLEVAKARTTCSEILEADIVSGSVLEDAKFDLITAFRFFPNAESELRVDAIKCLARHLQRDGILVFNNHRSTGFVRKRFARIVTGNRRGVSGMSSHEVSRLIEAAGLKVDRVFHTEVFPETESHPFRPRWIVGAVEAICARLPLGSLAHDMIYVCRHRDGSSQKIDSIETNPRPNM